MFPIDDPTAAASKPAAPAVGTPGWFRGGDPATNTPGTRVRYAWLNTVQAELLTILDAAGIAPDKADDGQVLQAMQRLFRGQNSQSFGVNGIWTCPDDVTRVKVRAWGGGGGGGGSFGNNSGGTGGAGGNYHEGIINVEPGTDYPVTVSTGGGGGTTTASAAGNGANGAPSSFGAIIVANGGRGGFGANGTLQTTGAAPSTGGAGGTLKVSGYASTSAFSIGNASFLCGCGGGTFCTANTSFSVAGAALAGLPGNFPGGGGNGGLCGGAGGNGASGLVIVEW